MTSTGQIQKRPIQIVFLHSRLQPAQIYLFKALRASGRVDTINVVYWDNVDKRGNLYKPEAIDGVTYIGRSTMNEKQLYTLLNTTKPEIAYVPGWMDSGYLSVLREFRRVSKIKVVAGIDDQWNGSLRQRMGAQYFKLTLRSLIDIFWVAGGPQRVFASHFGYGEKDVIPFLLSGNVTTLKYLELGTKKRFLFLGRFDPVKGLDTLINAYNELPETLRHHWDLELIGGGPLAETLSSYKNVRGFRQHGFIQPENLPELLSGGGVACFPGHHEQWGTAIHELAVAGYPLILSTACGSLNEFLINGYNGWSCEPGNVASLTTAFKKTANLSNTQRMLFSQRSRDLGMKITPELSAAALLSVIS